MLCCHGSLQAAMDCYTLARYTVKYIRVNLSRTLEQISLECMLYCVGAGERENSSRGTGICETKVRICVSSSVLTVLINHIHFALFCSILLYSSLLRSALVCSIYCTREQSRGEQSRALSIIIIIIVIINVTYMAHI